MTIDQFVSWVENSTLIELDRYSTDSFRWSFYDSREEVWIKSESIFDCKLDALKDLLEKIDFISVFER